jgi:type I restriction enzyme S subunit
VRLVADDELPPGWAQCRIGDISPVIGGGTPPSKDASNFIQDGGIPWLTPADLSGYREIYIARGARNLTTKGFSESSAKMLPKGALLFSSRAPVGYVAIASNPVCTNQGFKSFVLPEGFDSRFGYFYLRHIKPLAEDMATGTTFKELSGGTAAQLPFVFAPLAEQKRIADKLEAVLGRVDACRARLDRVPDLLKRFRQSVLAAATSGQLTEDWREKQGIGTEWKSVLFGDIVASSFYGPRFAADDYSDSGVPTIRTTDMNYRGEIDLSASPRIQLSESALERLGLKDGDIVVTRTGATIGKCGLYRDVLGPALPSAYLIRFRLDQKAVEPDFALLFLMSPDGQSRLVGGTTAVAQPNVNAKAISAIPLSLPTLPEQAEIIRRVEALFAMVDRIEARLSAARAQVERLTPATLSKAFRGDLVPQDPNDEPASKLLERLRTIASPDSKPKRRT